MKKILLLLICLSMVSLADSNDESQANNPLANFKALNLQNYYIGEFTENNQDANTAWLRYAQPLTIGDSQWLMRASLPFKSFPDPSGGKTHGLGDFNIFAAKIIDVGKPGLSFGIGPQVTLPTATDDVLGSEKWSGGFANVLFDARSALFQYGYLLTWQHSFAGDDDRDDVNVGAFQPFYFYQLGGGTYLRGAPISIYNFENDEYTVPVGLGVGQVIRKGDTVYNFFVEPQFEDKALKIFAKDNNGQIYTLNPL